MKDLLKQAVQALINEDIESAKKLYSQYFLVKSKSILEDMQAEGIVKGQCEGCGEDAVTTQKILDAKKWHCGKCEGTKFEPKKVESDDK